MKPLIILFLLVTSLYSHSEIVVVEEAVETQGIRVEYSDISNTGIIFPKNCEQCSKKSYTFDKNLKISHYKKHVSLQKFLKSYHDMQYPTLFLEPGSLKVLRVIY